MPTVPKNLHANYGLNISQDKGVTNVSLWLPWQLSYHSSEVYGWCLTSQRTSMSNMDSIRLKTKELLMYHCGCYGNLVTIATLYVADAYHPKEPLYQI